MDLLRFISVVLITLINLVTKVIEMRKAPCKNKAPNEQES